MKFRKYILRVGKSYHVKWEAFDGIVEVTEIRKNSLSGIVKEVFVGSGLGYFSTKTVWFRKKEIRDEFIGIK